MLSILPLMFYILPEFQHRILYTYIATYYVATYSLHIL